MIQVTREQMKKLRKQFPNIQATKTVHKYYVAETNAIMAFVKSNCKPPEKNYV